MRPPTTSDEAGILVITFDDPNSLNDGRSDAFRQSIYQVIDDRPNGQVAADLSPVEYLSSTGLAVLIGLKRRVEAQNGKLVLFQLHPYVQDVLRITKLSQFFTITPSRESALALLSTPSA
ncbi:MAG TPA: STAS domain-containing protein [Isosphaeraceae bacterium]|jgi:anti-sigma B factor antagonist|nr:STAS domain-containing protein [Isosphaeraceae bacterium]